MDTKNNFIDSPNKIEHFEDCIKIGNSWLFNSYTGDGYKVIRDNNNNVIGFELAYHLEEKSYTSVIDIPAGVLRKSYHILKLKMENNLWKTNTIY